MAAIGKACWPLAFLVAIVVSGQAAHAAPIQVTVDTSGLSGTLANLAFDLIAGGSPSNMVTVFDFASDGVLGDASITHDLATFDPAPKLTDGMGIVTLDDSVFSFTEYRQGITLGTTLTLRFETTGNIATPSFDAFSLFLLDDAGLTSLVSTADPSGALFLYSVGATDPMQPQVFTALVQASEVPAGAPEPGALALVMMGLLGLAMVLAVKQ